MKFTLPARRPFNFVSVIHSHGWYQLAPFQFDEESNTLYYVLQLANGRVVELQMRDAVDGVAVETDKLDKRERKEVTDKVKWMFDLDSDFSGFYAGARSGPKLARAEALARGRVLRSPTIFEDVIKTILTTNTLWGATRNMTRKRSTSSVRRWMGRLRNARFRLLRPLRRAAGPRKCGRLPPHPGTRRTGRPHRGDETAQASNTANSCSCMEYKSNKSPIPGSRP